MVDFTKFTESMSAVAAEKVTNYMSKVFELIENIFSDFGGFEVFDTYREYSRYKEPLKLSLGFDRETTPYEGTTTDYELWIELPETYGEIREECKPFILRGGRPTDKLNGVHLVDFPWDYLRKENISEAGISKSWWEQWKYVFSSPENHNVVESIVKEMNHMIWDVSKGRVNGFAEMFPESSDFLKSEYSFKLSPEAQEKADQLLKELAEGAASKKDN